MVSAFNSSDSALSSYFTYSRIAAQIQMGANVFIRGRRTALRKI